MKLFFLLNLTIGLGQIQIPIKIFGLIAKFIRYNKVGQNSYKFVSFYRQPIPSLSYKMYNIKSTIILKYKKCRFRPEIENSHSIPF